MYNIFNSGEENLCILEQQGLRKTSGENFKVEDLVEEDIKSIIDATIGEVEVEMTTAPESVEGVVDFTAEHVLEYHYLVEDVDAEDEISASWELKVNEKVVVSGYAEGINWYVGFFEDMKSKVVNVLINPVIESGSVCLNCGFTIPSDYAEDLCPSCGKPWRIQEPAKTS